MISFDKRIFKLQSGTLILSILLLLLLPMLILPLIELIYRSLSDTRSAFVGLRNFAIFFSTPGLFLALKHTLWIGLVVTTLTLVLAMSIAYGLTHARIPGAKLCDGLSLLPLFVPSLLPAIGLVYLLGEQGLARYLLCGHSIYGPIGIILGSIVFALPHAVLLLRAALQNIDRRQYAAAASLGAGPWRRFITVTLPNAQYGIISAAVAVFILTITDFGVPKVLGGSYSMLATEIYILVIGQRNFAVGAATSLILLLPTVLAVGLDMYARARQSRLRSDQTPTMPEPSCLRDWCLATVTWLSLGLILCVIGVVVLASFVAFWPYEMTLTLDNYVFEEVGYSWRPLAISIFVATMTAVFGCAFLITGAYTLERLPGNAMLKRVYRFLILLPLGLPGTTLGLAYIFAFSKQNTFWSFLYGTLSLLVMNCMVHFTSVTHMTAVSALNKLDKSYECVGASLGVPAWRTFFVVIAPLCRRPFCDMAMYLFVSTMSTVSAVVFLCDSSLPLASVSIVNMYDSGHLGPAAAMGTLMLAVTLVVVMFYNFSLNFQTKNHKLSFY